MVQSLDLEDKVTIFVLFARCQLNTSSRLSVLHEDQRAQIRTMLMCWKFGKEIIASLPVEILMQILELIACPPFVFCKRCFCCNKLVSGLFQCNWCVESVYFCNTDCQKRAAGIHAETCQRTKAEKRAKVDPPISFDALPPVLSDRDDNYVDMIQMRHPHECHFISALATALKTQ